MSRLLLIVGIVLGLVVCLVVAAGLLYIRLEPDVPARYPVKVQLASTALSSSVELTTADGQGVAARYSTVRDLAYRDEGGG